MKKIIFAAAILLACFSTWAAAPVNVNQKVLSAFKQTFGEVNSVRWSERGDFVEASFSQNNIQLHITYDLDGNVVKTIRYYDERQLPIFVASKIKHRFPGKSIFGVTEESTEQGSVYHIVLEDAATWTNVDATASGNIFVQNKFRKA